MLTRPAAATLLALSLLTTTASADTPRDFVDHKDVDGYSVVFKDDPLAAAGADPAGATIRARPSVARVGLLRPRVHFIPEMLKSVESL